MRIFQRNMPDIVATGDKYEMRQKVIRLLKNSSYKREIMPAIYAQYRAGIYIVCQQ